MTTEHEKIEREISHLRLEQEKEKLRQLQRRADAVSVATNSFLAIGKNIKAIILGIIAIIIVTIIGVIAGVISSSIFVILIKGGMCKAYPDADFLYKFGCLWGEGPELLLAGTVLITIIILFSFFTSSK